MPSFRDFLDNVLRERGPCTVDELAEAARQVGVTRARNPLDAVRAALRQSETAIALPDGRWSCAACLLDDAVLTHRVRASTAGRRDLWPRNDLFPFAPLFDRALPLASGGVLARADHRPPQPTVLVGPSGWLPSVDAGALLALRWRGGALQVMPMEVDPDAVADRVTLLRELFIYHREAKTLRSWRSPFGGAVLGALLEVPGLLGTALPPLGEILADLLRAPAEPVRPPRRACCCCCAPDYEVPYADDEIIVPMDLSADDPVIRPLFT
jgi:hypothetical protein